MANGTKPSDPGKVLPQASVYLLGWTYGTLNLGSGETCDVAKIQAFTADGRLVQMRTPTLFLVNKDPKPYNQMTDVGLAQLDGNVQLAKGLLYWKYDRNDQIARLDSSVGTVQRVVIDLEGGGSQTRRVDAVGQESSWMARLGLDH
ncbi:MAG: hypothetical protein U1E40_04280 [Amaricoccus sp.]